ncbi:hypothetical protein D8674_038828 [Pyrus ussuriensis x Pyrus communis]|uniref:Uncharacterized protein n=1 Tax=Pyrus ussuriensis x Pyrus communis TaxID=2448454 RepID=A0A5N5H6E8_9ROSA|nr:hypothetical protein D8674_038828 [Pyrus ussuriensis x Pyrus communis]
MPHSPTVGVEYVANLIVPETASWNINLVNELFLLNEAAMILATPLSCRLSSDKLIWHYDAKGFAVFCDEVGSYAGGFVRKISPASNPTMVEMLAVREVVQAIGNRVQGSSLMDLLVNDIHVCYVCRTANVAAHVTSSVWINSTGAVESANQGAPSVWIDNTASRPTSYLSKSRSTRISKSSLVEVISSAFSTK